jgi:sRNA-binding protein
MTEPEEMTTAVNSLKPHSEPTQAPKRREWHEQAVSTLAILQQRFPSCIAPLKQSHRWPLKIGIHADLLEVARDLEPVAIGRALQFYVRDSRYLKSMIAGRPRIDLAGAAFGIVTPEQAAAAEQSLSKRQPRRTAAVPPTQPKRLTLSDLKLAARQRRARGEP